MSPQIIQALRFAGRHQVLQSDIIEGLRTAVDAGMREAVFVTVNFSIYSSVPVAAAFGMRFDIAA